MLEMFSTQLTMWQHYGMLELSGHSVLALPVYYLSGICQTICSWLESAFAQKGWCNTWDPLSMILYAVAVLLLIQSF